ncbi:hypothetical protein Cgig2_017153 [Carnegiea gigantea]|uniref:Uncharacterized protein n=1 Tax=Carnegiea gigantea TaxID=171969 RepID=A0A9Q1GHH3_9CARY|nr:hypothetical protein Cgig2_017153 [Carnegiea gigantea]
MEAVNSARLLLTFDYVPTARLREVIRSERNRQSPDGNHDCSMGLDSQQARQAALGRLANFAIASTPYATHSQRTTWFKEQEQTLKPREGASWRNKGISHVEKVPTDDHGSKTTQCMFHKQNGYTNFECKELKKALHELADKRPDRPFLKERTAIPSQGTTSRRVVLRGDNSHYWWWICNRHYPVGMGGPDVRDITCPDNRVGNPYYGSHYGVVELKVASALIRRILIDTGSSVDIITWDCLKKLRHLGRKIIPLCTPFWALEDKR